MHVAAAEWSIDNDDTLGQSVMLQRRSGSFRDIRDQAGNFASSEILVLLGQNGCGKDRPRGMLERCSCLSCSRLQTTFIRMLAGLLNPDDIKEGSLFDASLRPMA